jgi:hypothetical protein
MKGARIDRECARAILQDCGALGVDYYTLPSANVESLLREADRYRYRAPKNRNGSRARYWHAYLARRAES